MRLLIRSEPEAFHLTVGIGLLAGVSILIGYLFGALVGVALFAFFLLAALLWDFATIRSERSALRVAAQAGHAHSDRDERPRILLVAGEAVTADALSEQIIRHRAPPPILDVVAPVLQSRTHFLTTDIDRETNAARRRLAQTLRCAAERDIDARGVVGDPIAPLAAIEDQLRQHDFDEVILATRPPEHTNWVETQILQRTRQQLSVPIRHIVIKDEAQRKAAHAR